MSTVRANSITNSAGTGAPDFPNGLTNNGAAVATAASVAAVNTALQFISSATISNVATVDFTGFDSSKYSDYVFSLDNVIPVTDAVILRLLMSVNGGSTFLSSYTAGAVLAGSTVSSSSFTGVSNITLTDAVGSDTNEFGVSGEVRVFGPDLVARTCATGLLMAITNAGTNQIIISSGQNEVTTAVNAVRFLFSSGNLESGVITMYGVRKS